MKEITKIEWKKEYEVGNFEIDFEHQIFVKIIQKIVQAHQEQKNSHYIERLILELYKYAEFHFCSEENIMLSIRYPDIKKHQKLHQDLLINLRETINTVNIDTVDYPELIHFIMDWFKEHTTGEDRLVADYINQTDSL